MCTICAPPLSQLRCSTCRMCMPSCPLLCAPDAGFGVDLQQHHAVGGPSFVRAGQQQLSSHTQGVSAEAHTLTDS